MTRFTEAILILVGMIVGVGMFAIPYAFGAAGVWLGLVELILLTGVVLVFHLLYGEIVLGTAGFHRLPGYVRIWLGPRAGALAWFSALFGIVGALLAYLVLGGLFLDALLRSVGIALPSALPALVIGMLGAVITFFPLRREALVNGILTAGLILFILGLGLVLLPQVEVPHLTGFRIEAVFVPYGILLFALSGGLVIPDLVTLLKRQRSAVRHAIAIGTLIPAVLYAIFAFTVVGVVGREVSPEAIVSLEGKVGESIILLAYIIGFLAAFTSLIVTSGSFQALLRLDEGAGKVSAWLWASGLPIALYLLGFQNFIAIVSAVGIFAVSIDSALVIAAHHEMRRNIAPRTHTLFADLLKVGLYILIAAGVLYELSRSIVAYGSFS